MTVASSGVRMALTADRFAWLTGLADSALIRSRDVFTAAEFTAAPDAKRAEGSRWKAR